MLFKGANAIMPWSVMAVSDRLTSSKFVSSEMWCSPLRITPPFVSLQFGYITSQMYLSSSRSKTTLCLMGFLL